MMGMTCTADVCALCRGLQGSA